MRVIKAILAAATLLAGFTFNAQAADPIEGKDYTVISPALQNDSPGKIEVTEFFWYGCSHCFHFENPLGNWAKTAPKDVVLRYIPAPLNPTWTPGARLYYALDALGAETRLRHDVFDAIHNQHSLFPTDESAFPKWVASKGVDAAKFSEVYASFTIMSKVQRANQITRAAGINGTPGLVVAGKYKVVEPGALSADQLANVLNALVAKARKDGVK